MTGTGKKAKTVLSPYFHIHGAFLQPITRIDRDKALPKGWNIQKGEASTCIRLHLSINLRRKLVLLLLSYSLLWSSSWQLRPNFLCDLSRQWLKPYCHPLMRYSTDNDKPIKECTSPENLQSVIDCSGRLTPPANSVSDLDACPLAPVSLLG